MGNGVFLFFGDFGGGDIITVRNEDRIVPEPALTGFFAGDLTFHDAVEKVFFSMQDQRDGSAETRPAGGVGRVEAVGAGNGGLAFAAGHLPEEPGDVVGRVLLRAAITGGVDAGGTGEDLDLQAGVVGEAVQAGLFVYVLGFLQGIGPEGLARLGDIFGNAGFGGRDELETLSEDLAGLTQLAGIAGGKNDLHKQLQLTPQRYSIFS